MNAALRLSLADELARLSHPELLELHKSAKRTVEATNLLRAALASGVSQAESARMAEIVAYCERLLVAVELEIDSQDAERLLAEPGSWVPWEQARKSFDL